MCEYFPKSKSFEADLKVELNLPKGNNLMQI